MFLLMLRSNKLFYITAMSCVCFSFDKLCTFLFIQVSIKSFTIEKEEFLSYYKISIYAYFVIAGRK